MRQFLIVLSLSLLLIPQLASAGGNHSGMGAGIILGEPTGLDAKMWLGEDSALQAAVAWSTSSNSSLHLHLDYILHKFDVFNVSSGSLPLYFGVGGRLKFRDDKDDQIGIRVPIGVSYMFANDPFDLFLEVVPILELVPDTDFGMNAAVGGRWYF
ncbi:hypothetical protein DRQ53_03080 [bacterium]|nr:MAG: hypothetical protein DRQ32_04020 [bacterium]RKZ17583.1 MAG: hypothetical protein DRQ53_03080 [bacterium]